MKQTLGAWLMFCFCIIALGVLGAIRYTFLCPPALEVSAPVAEDIQTVTVTLEGEVQNCGDYTVAMGTPLHDVIYLAGGFTAVGDVYSVDLQQHICSDCTITVKEALTDAVDVTASWADADSDNRYNINTASSAKLSNLPEIGKSTADAIVKYREEHGDFETIDEIKNVKGIGDKKFEDIKDLITVGGNS